MAFRWDKAEFRVFDPERGWELIWESSSSPALTYRLEHADGRTVRFSVNQLSGDDVEVLLPAASGDIEGLKTLIVEALHAYGRTLHVSFVEN